jgi:hypothetical protein
MHKRKLLGDEAGRLQEKGVLKNGEYTDAL